MTPEQVVKTAKALGIGSKELMRMFSYLVSINDLEGFRTYAVTGRIEAQKRAKENTVARGEAQSEAFRRQNAKFRENYNDFLNDYYLYQGDDDNNND